MHDLDEIGIGERDHRGHSGDGRGLVAAAAVGAVATGAVAGKLLRTGIATVSLFLAQHGHGREEEYTWKNQQTDTPASCHLASKVSWKDKFVLSTS